MFSLPGIEDFLVSHCSLQNKLRTQIPDGDYDGKNQSIPLSYSESTAMARPSWMNVSGY